MRAGGATLNGYGVEVSLHRCPYCWGAFTVTPATSEGTWGLGCLAEGCPSYDVGRDADLFFGVAQEQGWIKREGAGGM